MVNYYEEFNLDPNMSSEAICDALFQEKKKWIHRQNANDLDKRHKAEQMIALIEEAAMIFSDKLKRDQYDLKILKAQKKGNGAPGQQQSAQQHYEQNQQTVSEPTGSNTDDIETIIANARTFYEAGNTKRTADYCNRMIGSGADSPYLYNYLGLSYWDNDEVNLAVETFMKAIDKYPLEPLFCANLASIYLNTLNNYTAARTYIDKAIQMDSANNWYLSLDITYMFYTGDVDAAEAKIQQHLSTYPNDQEYRQYISEAYISYSDKFLVQTENGGAYIPSQQAFDSILYYRNKAKDILNTERTQNLVNVIEERGKREFNKDNLKGIGCLVVLGTLFLAPLLPLWLILAGVLAYFSYKPNWLIEKMALTNQRDMANTISYYLYVASSYLLRFFIWFIKFVFYIIFSFV